MATDAILDSSIIVALVTPEKYSGWARRKIENYEYFHALDLSFYEVANSIEYKVPKELDTKDAIEILRKAEKMMNLFTVHTFSESTTDLLKKALELKITTYDAAFLSLSDKLKMPFLTLDIKLAKKLEHTKYYELVECPNEASI
jgi:predicted nucleic acid-binding protein